MFGHHLDEPGFYPLGLDINAEGLIKFIESNRYSNILTFDIDSANLHFNGRKTALALFHKADDSDAII